MYKFLKKFISMLDMRERNEFTHERKADSKASSNENIRNN